MVNYEQSENKIKPTGDHSFKMVGQSKTIRLETQAPKTAGPDDSTELLRRKKRNVKSFHSGNVIF